MLPKKYNVKQVLSQEGIETEKLCTRQSFIYFKIVFLRVNCSYLPQSRFC